MFNPQEDNIAVFMTTLRVRKPFDFGNHLDPYIVVIATDKKGHASMRILPGWKMPHWRYTSGGMFRLLANGWLCLWQKRRDLSPWVMKSVKRCFTPLLTGLLPNAMPFIALPENPEGLIWILKWRRNWG